MGEKRAVVFPGQGTVGGEVSGTVADAVKRLVGGAEVPYQLGVFAHSVGLFYRMREAGIVPDVVAGHSLGEYAAAHACGSLGLEDGVRLVAERDRLMSQASRENRGGMVALIGADPEDVERAVADTAGVAVAANFNTPRQTVISGEPAALEEAAAGLRGRTVKLDVAGAFHSPLMADAAREMRGLLEGVELEEPWVPMVGAAEGSVLGTAREIREALQEQVLSPVRWTAVMEKLFGMGVNEIYEAGEDGTLTRMLKDFKRKDVRGVAGSGALA